MSDAWQKLDLEGGGLQAANRRLVQLLRRRPVAYALWLAFPLGAHRYYLRSPRGGLLYLALSALALLAWLVAGPGWALLALAPAAALALHDLWWIDTRVTALNKQIRTELYLGMGAAPPRGYRGRYPAGGDVLDEYVREKEKERAGVQPVQASDQRPTRRAPSFKEQEEMLKNLRDTRKNEEREG